MKSLKFLEDLSKLTGKNDRQIAILLGIQPSAVSQYRSGKRIMDDETCLAVAIELGVDPMMVVGAACVDRAEKTGQRSLWENFLMNRMAAAAVLLLLVSVNLFLTPDANAAVESKAYVAQNSSNTNYANDIYIEAIAAALRAIFTRLKTAPT